MLIPNTSCVARMLMLVCAFSWAGLAAQPTLADCSLFAEGSNANWGHVLTLTTPADDNSNAAQSFEMNITSLPEGAQYRVYKTTQNGGDFFGPAQNLSLGVNSATIGGVNFARTVKIQFSDGDIQFDALSINGVEQTDCLATEDGTLMSDCNAIDAGPNENWPAVWTLTTPDDGNSSDEQEAEIVITSLPDGGANYRVVKTVPNGNWNNGPAQPLSLGTNTITVSGVTFDRSVKLQFSSAAIEISSLTLNDEAVACEDAGPTTHPVTFSVNTDNIEVGDLGMYIGGGFLGPANAHALNDNGNNNWSLTLDLEEGASGHWVFLNSPCCEWSWDTKEDLAGLECGDPNAFNDRYLDAVTGPVTLEYCFGECTAECPEPPSVTYPVTFIVHTDNIEVGATGMHIGGGFLGGSNAYQLTDNGEDTWSITLDLFEGQSGHWAFFNGPGWDSDWNTKENLAGLECGDPNAFNDRYLAPISGPTTLEYCFGTCETECPAPPSVTYPVTFIVHTDNIEVGATGMHIGGGFLGGSNAYQLTDQGGDTWSITLDLFEGTAGHWVFFNAPGWDSDWNTKENLAGLECGDPNAYNDRYLAPISGPTTLEYCFGTCDTECSSDVLGCMDPNFDNYNAEANVDDGTCANVSGAWQLASLCVGWNNTDGICGWWSYSAPGDRTCLEDDIYYMGEDGTFQNILGDDTWLEGWQSGTDEACGAPVAPHDGSNAATWSLVNGEITLNGLGAYLGLPKAYNGGELNYDNTTPPASRTYIISSLSSTSLEVDIQVGGGWWRFGFTRTSATGCMDMGACNYDDTAVVPDAASCTYPPHPNFDCDGNCNNDEDGDGICDELEGLIPEAETACGIGTMWDAELGQCVYNVECAGDINLDGAITANDILLMLTNFGTWCPGYGPDAE